MKNLEFETPSTTAMELTERGGFDDVKVGGSVVSKEPKTPKTPKTVYKEKKSKKPKNGGLEDTRRKGERFGDALETQSSPVPKLDFKKTIKSPKTHMTEKTQNLTSKRSTVRTDAGKGKIEALPLRRPKKNPKKLKNRTNHKSGPKPKNSPNKSKKGTQREQNQPELTSDGVTGPQNSQNRHFDRSELLAKQRQFNDTIDVERLKRDIQRRKKRRVNELFFKGNGKYRDLGEFEKQSSKSQKTPKNVFLEGRRVDGTAVALTEQASEAGKTEKSIFDEIENQVDGIITQRKLMGLQGYLNKITIGDESRDGDVPDFSSKC